MAMPFTDKTNKYIQISSDPNGGIVKLMDQMTAPILTKEGSPYEAGAITKMVHSCIDLNDNALNDPVMKKLLDDPNTHFDLVVVQPLMAGEAGYYLAHRWKAPLAIYYTAQSNLPFINTGGVTSSIRM